MNSMIPESNINKAANEFLTSVSILEILPTVQQKAEFADRAIKTILDLKHFGFCLHGYKPLHPFAADCQGCLMKDAERMDKPFGCPLQNSLNHRVIPLQTTEYFFGYFIVSGDSIEQLFPVEQLLSNFLTIFSLSIDNLIKKHDLKKLTSSLQESGEHYRKAQEVGHVGSWEYDIKKDLFWGSDEGKRMYGFHPEKDIFTAGEVMKCVIDKDRVNQALIDLIDHNAPYNIVFDIIPLNSTEKRTIHSTAELIRDEKGHPVLVSGVLHDITDRQRVEEELKAKNEALQKLNSEKDKFFSIIAHDLRSPFTAFLGFTRMMVEDLPSLRLDEVQRIAMAMRNSATNLYLLLENLLEWSRIQGGVTGFNPAFFPVMPKITEDMQSVLESANKKGIQVRYNIPEDLAVFADGDMFGSTIRNLANNAVKFTPKGGEITISAQSLKDNSVEISVKDTGIGMSKDMVGKLFLLTENTNRKGTDGEPSTGLGLIICKEFVEKHGGKIRVESEEGKGSTFRFTIPAGNRQ